MLIFTWCIGIWTEWGINERNISLGWQLPLDKMAAILAEDIFKCIFLNGKVSILIKISLRFVPTGLIDNNK